MKYNCTPKEARAFISVASELSELMGKKDSDPRVKATFAEDGSLTVEAEEELVLGMLDVFKRYIPVIGAQAKSLCGTLELAFADYDKATAIPKEKVEMPSAKEE